MPAFCAVVNCGDKYTQGENISFHKFPHKRKDLLDKWIKFTRRGPDWKPSKWSSICSHHFLSDDFSNINARKTLKKTAVPSIAPALAEVELSEVPKTTTMTKTPSVGAPFDFEEEHDNEEMLHTMTTTSNLSKNNCRFCGICCCSVATFATNFEIFGMIQKCFPTLNIQQDDNLPKDMCTTCLNHLKSFSEFIDRVLETQQDLQRKFRIEKPTVRPPERSLKIKQEPVVKVKQEAGDSFLSDELDMAMDDCDQDSYEQKFPFFSDFPMLNAQDIINNCDIMEIINLDDPFIDIPDDDGTAVPSETDAIAHTSRKEFHTEFHTGAYQQLQLQMIIDEHNYTIPIDETKDTLNIGNFYKTEKTEMHDEESDGAGIDGEEDFPTIPFGIQSENYNALITAQPKFAINGSFGERNSKPIVTSVSAIAESRLQIQQENRTDKLVVTSISDLLPATREFQTRSPANYHNNQKPNIVVLNESIVQSGSTFQLYSCHLCHLQFFAQESLNNHINVTHVATAPMVSLPLENVPCEFADSMKNVSINSTRSFRSVYNLLRHKRKSQEKIHIKRPFISSCPQCEKFFVSKISLSNHMNHICHAMSMKSQKKSIINFRCRYCQNITFNHWRVLRNHETNCKRYLKEMIRLKEEHKCKVCGLIYSNSNSLARHETCHKRKKQLDMICSYCDCQFNSIADIVQHYCQANMSCKSKLSGAEIAVICRICNKNIDSLQRIRSHRHLRKQRTAKLSYPCQMCRKIFPTSNSLAQHRITHIEEKRHKCDLCLRVFKRRGGLTQHMKGFHLKVKPHECSVCKRPYALKADMMRCRHSLLKMP